MSWLDGDLKVFAAGLAVGGEWNLAQVHDSFTPTVWNTPDDYSCFYLDFLRPIRAYSLGQFADSVRVVAGGKFLPYQKAEQVSPRIVRVYVNLSGQEHGVMVVGSDRSRLNYETGKTVPGFITTFYVAGLMVYVDFAWIFERVQMPEFSRATERGAVGGYSVTSTGGPHERTALPEFGGAVETAGISYFEV